MKFNQNKKRNTDFIFEALIKELTKASLSEDVDKKNNTIGIIKKYFSKGHILKEELEIYKSLTETSNLDNRTIEKILAEAKRQYANLNRNSVFEAQSRLISEINSKLGHSVWNNFVYNYKKLATISLSLSQTAPPKKQVILEKKLLESLSAHAEKTKKKFPKINNLALNNFVEKFNSQYSEHLTEEQCQFLTRYITATDGSGVEYKTYIYEEVDKIKKFLTENKESYGEGVSSNIESVLEKISSFRDRKFDNELIFEIFRMQALVKELQTDGI